MPTYFRILIVGITEQNTDNFIRYTSSSLIWCPQDWMGVALSDSTKILRPAIRECALVSCFHFIMKKLNLVNYHRPGRVFPGMCCCKSLNAAPCPVAQVFVVSLSIGKALHTFT